VPGPTDLILIRHAPALNGGRLAGRRDVAADLPDADTFARLREALGPVDRLLTGPALRCQMTAAALFPGQRVAEDARLWEQDFGAWEGCPPGDLPDLGSLDRAALANHRPPGGESFADLCSRVAPALIAAASGGRVAVVAHAGTMRAALALALGDAAVAMAFEIAPLSTTLIRALPGGQWSVGHVNRTQA
jgi:alpha-ribazole phosphatase